MDKRQNALRRAMKVILPVLLVFIVILSILVLIHLAGPLNDTPLPLDENQSSLLSGQTWHLNFYWTGNATTPVIEKTDVVIAFSDDGRVSGLSGCNIYFGEYDLSGDTLQIHQIESTQMTSTSEVLNQEKIFFSLLLKTKKYVSGQSPEALSTSFFY